MVLRFLRSFRVLRFLGIFAILRGDLRMFSDFELQKVLKNYPHLSIVSQMMIFVKLFIKSLLPCGVSKQKIGFLFARFLRQLNTCCGFGLVCGGVEVEELRGESAGAEDFEFVAFGFDEGGRGAADGAGVFDVSDMLEEGGRNLARVGDGRLAGEVGASGDERMSDFADDSEELGVVGNTDADERATGGDLVGNLVVFWEEDGERAREEVLNEVFFERVEVFCVGADHVEVVHKQEERLGSVAAFGGGDFCGDIRNGGVG